MTINIISINIFMIKIERLQNNTKLINNAFPIIIATPQISG